MRRFLLHQLLPLAVVFLGIASYFTLATQFGVYQRLPWLHFLIVVAGCGWLVTTLVKKPGVMAGLSLALGLLLCGTFFWYTLSYSIYDGTNAGAAVGEQVEGLTALALPNPRGETTPLLLPPETAKATLVVLYRGYW
ncbi:MAG: hypothetical protein AAGN66_07805 [Acidobacteriota bacterium]